MEAHQISIRWREDERSLPLLKHQSALRYSSSLWKPRAN